MLAAHDLNGCNRVFYSQLPTQRPQAVPASSSACTAGALTSGVYAKAGQAAVVGMPLTSTLSFTVHIKAEEGNA